jgi:hypothetical protein
MTLLEHQCNTSVSRQARYKDSYLYNGHFVRVDAARPPRYLTPLECARLQGAFHCCYAVVPMLFYCCYTVLALLLHCRYIVITILLHCTGFPEGFVWPEGRKSVYQLVGNAVCAPIIALIGAHLMATVQRAAASDSTRDVPLSAALHSMRDVPHRTPVRPAAQEVDLPGIPDLSVDMGVAMDDPNERLLSADTSRDRGRQLTAESRQHSADSRQDGLRACLSLVVSACPIDRRDALLRRPLSGLMPANQVCSDTLSPSADRTITVIDLETDTETPATTDNTGFSMDTESSDGQGTTVTVGAFLGLDIVDLSAVPVGVSNWPTALTYWREQVHIRPPDTRPPPTRRWRAYQCLASLGFLLAAMMIIFKGLENYSPSCSSNTGLTDPFKPCESGPSFAS